MTISTNKINILIGFLNKNKEEFIFFKYKKYELNEIFFNFKLKLFKNKKQNDFQSFLVIIENTNFS